MYSTDNDKEVYFDQYCSSCINATKKENEDPCEECLAEPYRQHSHKPVNYKEK